MRCDDVRRLLPDRLDDLLEPEAAVEVDAHVEACEACREARGEAERLRAALYRPWAVAEASPSLAARIARPRARPTVHVALALLRYAAVFAAGVLVARHAAAPPSRVPVPETTPAAISAPLAPSALPDYPRRIR